MSSFAVVLEHSESKRTVRGSLQSRAAAAVSKRTIRPLTAVLPIERTWGLWLSRQILARRDGRVGPSLSGTHVEYVDTVLPDGRRLVGEWVQARRPAGSARSASTAAGYTLCSPRTHRRLTSWLSRLTGLPVFVVDYRLAPRTIPRLPPMMCAGWDWLIGQQGLAPELDGDRG